MQENNVFAVLNALNCNEHTERKGNLTYLSWAWAWQMVKSHYPDASIRVSHVVKGRIPEAIQKPVSQLLESDMTII